MHQTHSSNLHGSVETDAVNVNNSHSNNSETDAADISSNGCEEGRTRHVDVNNWNQENCFWHGSEPATLNTSFTIAPARSFAFRQEYLKEMYEQELYNEPFYRNMWTSQTPSRAQSSLHRYNENRPGNYSFHSHHSFVNNWFNRSHSQITHPHVMDRSIELPHEDNCEHLTLRDAHYMKAVENLKAPNFNVSASASTSALGVPTATRDEDEQVDQNVDVVVNEETNLPEFAIDSIEDEAISE